MVLSLLAGSRQKLAAPGSGAPSETIDRRRTHKAAVRAGVGRAPDFCFCPPPPPQSRSHLETSLNIDASHIDGEKSKMNHWQATAWLPLLILAVWAIGALLSAAVGLLAIPARAIAARFTSKRAARATGESRVKRPHCVQLLAARPGSHPLDLPRQIWRLPGRSAPGPYLARRCRGLVQCSVIYNYPSAPAAPRPPARAGPARQWPSHARPLLLPPTPTPLLIAHCSSSAGAEDEPTASASPASSEPKSAPAPVPAAASRRSSESPARHWLASALRACCWLPGGAAACRSLPNARTRGGGPPN